MSGLQDLFVFRGHPDAISAPAFNAMRYNPMIRSFANRLAGNGKPFKVVVVAAMRKLLLILNAILKNNTPWKEIPCVVPNVQNA